MRKIVNLPVEKELIVAEPVNIKQLQRGHPGFLVAVEDNYKTSDFSAIYFLTSYNHISSKMFWTYWGIQYICRVNFKENYEGYESINAAIKGLQNYLTEDNKPLPLTFYDCENYNEVITLLSKLKEVRNDIGIEKD
jgi:hypothetical protein